MTLVPAPLKFPNGCIKCRSTKGPIYDGGSVGAVEWEFYLCRTCAEVVAVEYGIAPGAEMDRLRDAAAELAQRDEEARRFAAQQADSARIVSGLRAEIAKAKAERQEFESKWLTAMHAAQDVREAVGVLSGGDAGKTFGMSTDPED